MELRGGTHLVLVPGAGRTAGDAPFDLMVDDLDAIARRQWSRARHSTSSPIAHDRIHDSFTFRDPDGHVVTVNNSHVVGAV